MPAAFRSALLRAVVPALVATPLLLTSCGGSTQPPGVTIRAGDSSARIGASAYLLNGTLHKYDRAAPVLEVRAGQALDIDVDPTVARIGWVASINSQQVASVQHDRVHRVTVPDLGTAGVLELMVFQAPQDDQQTASGSWTFVLARAS